MSERFAVLLLVVAVTLNALVFARLNPDRIVPGTDSTQYDLMARQLAASRGFTAEAQPPFVPTQFREGTEKDYVARLDDATEGRRVRQAIEKGLAERQGGKTLRIAAYARTPYWQGKDLVAIAEAEKRSPLDIVLEIEHNGGASVVSFGMKEEDVRLIMKQSFVATASAICGTSRLSRDRSVPENVCVAKLAAVIVSWKGPGATFANENCPSSLVTTSWFVALPSRENFTRAPGTTDPLRSTTVPLTLPGNC